MNVIHVQHLFWSEMENLVDPTISIMEIVYMHWVGHHCHPRKLRLEMDHEFDLQLWNGIFDGSSWIHQAISIRWMSTCEHGRSTCEKSDENNDQNTREIGRSVARSLQPGSTRMMDSTLIPMDNFGFFIISWIIPMEISMDQFQKRYVSTIFQAISWGDIPWNVALKNRPETYGIRTSNFHGYLSHSHWYKNPISHPNMNH